MKLKSMKSIYAVIASIAVVLCAIFALNFTDAGRAVADQAAAGGDIPLPDPEPVIKVVTGSDLPAGQFDSAAYDEIYGVVGGNYAIEEKKVEFDSGNDTAVNIIRSDGKTTFSTSIAQTKYEDNPVWSDYEFKTTNIESHWPSSTSYIARSIQNNTLLPVLNKKTNKVGAIDKDGNFIVSCEYSNIDILDDFVVGRNTTSTEIVCDFFAVNQQGIKRSLSFSNEYNINIAETYGKYVQINLTKNQPYSTVDYYYKWDNNTLVECNNISCFNEGAWAGIDNILDNYVSYAKTDCSLWLVDKNENETKVCNTQSVPSSIRCCNAFLHCIWWNEYFNPTDEKYYTFDGIDMTDVFSGKNIIYELYNGNFVAYNPNTDKTELINKNKQIIRTVNGHTSEIKKRTWKNNYVLTDYLWNVNVQSNSNLYKLKIYDSNLQNIIWSTEIEDIEKVNPSLYCNIIANKVSDFYEIGYYWYTDIFHNCSKYYDFNFNEIDSIPNFVLKDGTYIYNKQDDSSKKSNFVDKDGNKIVRNGYTLDTSHSSFCYHNGELQHGLDDLFWAVDTSGKYGIIDSYGNVKVPFVYDKQVDLGCSDTDYALGFKDGKWSFINVKNSSPAIKHTISFDQNISKVFANGVEITSGTEVDDGASIEIVPFEVTDKITKVYVNSALYQSRQIVANANLNISGTINDSVKISGVVTADDEPQNGNNQDLSLFLFEKAYADTVGVEGAVVSFVEADDGWTTSTSTNTDGSFNLSVVKGKAGTLTVQKEGYNLYTKEISALDLNEDVYVPPVLEASQPINNEGGNTSAATTQTGDYVLFAITAIVLLAFLVVCVLKISRKLKPLQVN